MKSDTIYSVQALRGLAVFLVVMFHFREDLSKTYGEVADLLFINGSIGVDLFFMISGFIAYYVYVNENSGLSSSKIFLVKRLCRIIPPYFLVTLMVAGNSVDSWMEALRSMLFLPGDSSSQAPWFGYAKLDVGWTLNYEMLFYVLCATSLIFRSYKFVALTALISAFVFIPYVSLVGTGDWANRHYGLSGYFAIVTNGIMLEFIAGMLIGYLHLGKVQSNHKMLWVMAILFSSTLFALELETGFLRGNGRPGFFISSFLLLFSMVGYECRFGMRIPSLLLLLGATSYSVYLVHTRAMSIAQKIIYNRIDEPSAGVMVFILSIVLTVIFTCLMYTLVEKRLCSFIRSLIFKRESLDSKKTAG